jgi:hypothetical protein
VNCSTTDEDSRRRRLVLAAFVMFRATRLGWTSRVVANCCVMDSCRLASYTETSPAAT